MGWTPPAGSFDARERGNFWEMVEVRLGEGREIGVLW